MGIEAAENLMRDIWRDFQSMEADRHAANPDAHKKSLFFRDGLRYRYYETKRKGRPTIRWCYTSTKNVAGYFLCFRQTVTKKAIRNDEVSAFKRKCDAIATARMQHEKLSQ